MRFNVALSTLLFAELWGGIHSDLRAQTTSVTVGPGTGSNLSGAVTLYGASPGTGSAVLTVANSGSAQTTATVPYVTGNIVIDSALNVFTNKNDFSSSTASVILPNVATFSPSALGQVAYNTTQQDLVSQGNQSVGGSIPRVLSVTIPATADVICAKGGDSICAKGGDSTIGNCVNGSDGTTTTAFKTTFALPADFLLSGKRLVFTADFALFNSTVTPVPTVVVGMALDSASGEALYTSGALGQPPAGHGTSNGLGFSGSWALTGASALGAGASTIANAVSLNFPGAAMIGIANQVSQPPSGWSTNAAHTIVLTIQYSVGTAGNAIRLQTLTVEELN